MAALVVRQKKDFAVAFRLHASPLNVGILRASTTAACRAAGSGYTFKPSTKTDHHHEHFSKLYYSTSPGKLAAKWLRKQLLVLFAIAGVTGGALLVVSVQCVYAIMPLKYLNTTMLLMTQQVHA